MRAKGIKRERDRESTAADIKNITAFYIYLPSRREHSIDVLDNIYGCVGGFFPQMLF